jgi:hypothetical protein
LPIVAAPENPARGRNHCSIARRYCIRQSMRLDMVDNDGEGYPSGPGAFNA